MKAIAALLALLMLCTPAAAQDVLGRSMIDGRRVELLSDGTWRFSEPSPSAGCANVAADIFFCGSYRNWRPTNSAATDFDAMFRHSDRLYGGMIYEEVGSLAGIDYDYMISVALDNVAHAAGTSPDMVPILDIMDIEVSDLPAQTIIYAGKVNNLGVVYANTFVIRENDVTQILTWEITRDYTEKHSNMHADFLANTRYEKEATDAH